MDRITIPRKKQHVNSRKGATETKIGKAAIKP